MAASRTSGNCTFRPTGIVTRRSTEIMAISDPKVAAAMEFIRRHACDGIDVVNVLRRVLIARSVLQRAIPQGSWAKRSMK